MRCGLQIDLPLEGRPSPLRTLSCGLRIFLCRLNHLETWTHHEEDYPVEALEALCNRLCEKLAASGLLSPVQFDAIASKIVVCLVPHPMEHQERPDKTNRVPPCFVAAGIDPAKVAVLKVPTLTARGESVPCYQRMLEEVFCGVCKSAAISDNSETAIAAKVAALPLVETDVKAVKEQAAANKAKLEWCYGHLSDKVVRDWLTKNPPPHEWVGVLVKSWENGHAVDVPIGWAWEHRDIIYPPMDHAQMQPLIDEVNAELRRRFEQ
jgi:hypothetical protein